MEIQETQKNEVKVFRLSGRLDSNTSPTLEKKINEAIENGVKNMVVDFEKLEYISSAGLGVLLRTHKRLMGQGDGLQLVNVNSHINDIFTYSGFDRLFDIQVAAVSE
jgi:anti-sigma B factor antagonist